MIEFQGEIQAVHDKVDVLIRALHHLLTKENDMSAIHDQIKAILDEAGTEADKLIASKTQGDSDMADMVTEAGALRDKLKAANDAEASASVSTATGADSLSGGTDLTSHESLTGGASTL